MHMICNKCGATILEDSRFCENCGAGIEKPDPAFQPVPVTPVYPPNSVYAANAYAVQRPQPVVAQPLVSTPVQQYQAPAYVQPAPAPVYQTYDPNPGNKTFNKVLRIISIVSLSLYTLAFLVMIAGESIFGGANDALTVLSLMTVSGFSTFVLVFSCVRKKIGKGLFLALLIPSCLMLYLFLSAITGS